MAVELPAPWLEAAGLTKEYGGVVALRDATLSLRPGELRGLIGANGAGKSTLVKILTGLVAPSAGRLLVDGREVRLGIPQDSLRAGIVAVPQELTVAPNMTVAENIEMGRYPRLPGGFLRAREMRRRASETLRKLSLPMSPDDIVGELPIASQRLVMVARAFAVNARLMIFDEPTATISPQEVGLLLDAIRGLARREISILYVSHRLDEIDEICTAVTVVRDGRIVADLGHDEITRQTLVDHLVGNEIGAAVVPPRVVREAVATEALLEIRDVIGPGLAGVSLRVERGEVVGLAGMAGSGAREVVLAACGALRLSSGSVSICGDRVRPGSVPSAMRAGAGFLPGDRSLAAFSSHSIGFNVTLPTVSRHAMYGFIRTRAERLAVAGLLDRVGLRRDQSEPMASLSGGNQQRAMVARWFAAAPALLLLDDPTAGVDIATRTDIYAKILSMCAEGVGVLLLSSDVDELVALCSRVAVLDRGTVRAMLVAPDLTPANILDAMTRREPLVAAGAS